MNGPKLKKTFNPLKTTLSLLIIIIISNIFYKPLYELSYYINIFGCFLVFLSIFLFTSAENEFMKFREDANPPTGTKKILDKNIYSFVKEPNLFVIYYTSLEFFLYG